MTLTIQSLQDSIAAYQADTDRLVETYGKGVRPGWVSTEIALNDLAISKAQQKIEQLEKPND